VRGYSKVCMVGFLFLSAFVGGARERWLMIIIKEPRRRRDLVRCDLIAKEE